MALRFSAHEPIRQRAIPIDGHDLPDRRRNDPLAVPQLLQAIAARRERGRPCRNTSRRRECVAVGALCAEIDVDGCNWGQLGFPARVTRQYSWTSGLGGLMTQTEVEKSSRAIAEQAFRHKEGRS